MAKKRPPLARFLPKMTPKKTSLPDGKLIFQEIGCQTNYC